jgi:hypothetical protein
LPKASVLLKELEQAVPAGVAKLIVEVGVVELDVDDELSPLPLPPQATKQIRRQEKRGYFRLVIVGVIEEKSIK